MIVANDIEIHYQRMSAKDHGAGPPPTVVFIHGLGTDSLASFYLTLAAPMAAAGIEVIAYDLRGHGRTALPSRGYQVDDFVADLDALLHQLGVNRPVHLVGNSFGGTIAFSYAVARPERVATIVSIEAEPATEPWAGRMRHLLDEIVAHVRSEEFWSWLTQTFGSHHARLTRSASKLLLTTTMAADLTLGCMLGLDALQSIRCPVLSIVGSEGFHKDDVTALQAVLPNCRTEVVAGQDHSVLVQAHRTVRQLLQRWVAEHDRTDDLEIHVA